MRDRIKKRQDRKRVDGRKSLFLFATFIVIGIIRYLAWCIAIIQLSIITLFIRDTRQQNLRWDCGARTSRWYQSRSRSMPSGYRSWLATLCSRLKTQRQRGQPRRYRSRGDGGAGASLFRLIRRKRILLIRNTIPIRIALQGSVPICASWKSNRPSLSSSESTESSIPSPSVSFDFDGSSGNWSCPSGTPSLSSSASPIFPSPSPSVSESTKTGTSTAANSPHFPQPRCETYDSPPAPASTTPTPLRPSGGFIGKRFLRERYPICLKRHRPLKILPHAGSSVAYTLICCPKSGPVGTMVTSPCESESGHAANDVGTKTVIDKSVNNANPPATKA